MFRDKTAARTGLGSIPRVDQFNQDAGNLSFVGNKLTELIESPRMVAAPLAMSNLCPLPDAIQIFQGNQARGAFSLRHQLLADYVVGILSKVGLSTREFSEMSFSRFRSLALERCLEFISFLSNLIYLLSRVKLAIAINGKVNDTEVNADSSNRVIGCGFGGINSNSKIKHAFPQNKVSLLDHTIYPGFLISTNPDRDNLPALKSEDRNFIQPFERQNALVVDHSRMGIEYYQLGLVSAVSIGDLPNTANCHLSGEPVVFAEFLVGKMVEFYLSRCVVAKGKLGDIIAGFVKAFHSLKKRLTLLWTWSKFYHQGLLHNCSIDKYLLPVKYFERRVSASSAT